MDVFLNNEVDKIFFGDKEVLGIFKGNKLLYPTNPPIEEDNGNEYFYFKIHNRLQIAEVGFEKYLYSGRSGGNTTPTVNWSSFTSYVEPTFEYSYDKVTWNQYTLGTAISIGRGQLGDIVYFRGDNLDPWMEEYQQTVTETTTYDGGSYDSTYTHTFRVWTHAFINNAQVQCNGNIMSLRYKNYQNQLTLPCNYTFAALFSKCNNLLRGPILPATTIKPYCYIHLFLNSGLMVTPTLPATTMQERCYGGMFAGSKITTPPALPATTLAAYCYGHTNSPYTAGLTTSTTLSSTDYKASDYYGMFSNSSITTAPTLSATTLQVGCYQAMFSSTKITTPPVLPSTSLADYCYQYMFRSSSITSMPTLSATTLKPYCYYGMFYSTSSLKTPGTLPATTLANYCYSYMFYSSGLTTAPTLPATALANYCYQYMFAYTNFTTPPKLSATTLKPHCYDSMFYYADITTPPTLPATTLAEYCYSYMFAYAKFTTAPALPATTLASYCYNYMFYRAEITIPPSLPATTLVSNCYYEMFYYCKKLTKIPRLNATTLASYCYSYMFEKSNVIASASSASPCTYAYRVPYSGTGTDEQYKSGLGSMFSDSSGNAFTPTINTTFYINVPSF